MNFENFRRIEDAHSSTVPAFVTTGGGSCLSETPMFTGEICGQVMSALTFIR